MYVGDDGLEIYIEKEKDCIKSFFANGYSFLDIAIKLNEKGSMGNYFFFSFGIEYEGRLFVYDSENCGWKETELKESKIIYDKYKQIEEYFLSLSAKSVYGYKICRWLTGIKKKIEGVSENQLEYQVYYVLLFDTSLINPIFIHCFEAAYYKWLVPYLITALNKSDSESKLKEEEKTKLTHGISEKFREYMLEIMGIDIDFITALSGIYYENQPCSSSLVFLLSKNFLPSDGIVIREPVECTMDNIQKIRKLLQTGTENHSLLICRSEEKWFVKGLYQAEKFIDGNVIFRIRSHMFWNMEIGKQLAVCYKCGEYRIDCKEFEWSRLETEYKRVFGKASAADIEPIFSEAIGQKHGTVLAVIQKYAAGIRGPMQETKRLAKESAGTEIEELKLDREFVKGLTAIDGALILDDTGLCYGFGMILDANIGLQGNSGRGARFNSTRKYIKTCQNQGIKALGVVISEDGMIDIFTTEDNFEEDGKNGKE